MPIFKTQFGKHSDVLFVEFGTGDIEFTKSREESEDRDSILFFRQHAIPHKIGETSGEHIGKTTDEIEGIQLVFKFKKHESITALIHSLVELQENMLGLNSDSTVQGSVATGDDSNSKVD